jgi:Domain of unknown function (DUF4280)
MGKPTVVMGAMLECSFGMAPAPLKVLPDKMVLVEGRPVANVSDFATLENVGPFGECITLSNPMVAAATAAALGVLTPMPCIPVSTPWIPTSTTLVGELPVVTEGAMCTCGYGGEIAIIDPGTAKTLM